MAETRVLADQAEELAALSARVLCQAEDRGISLATAESCTGGLLASLLTDIEGLSGCFERGFGVYTDDATAEMLSVDLMAIQPHRAVSAEVALPMARGALARSHADLAVAITGFAGPAGKADEEGLVHIAVAVEAGPALLRECHFGTGGRDRTRYLAAKAALEM